MDHLCPLPSLVPKDLHVAPVGGPMLALSAEGVTASPVLVFQRWTYLELMKQQAS
jgi:hypothetical protein